MSTVAPPRPAAPPPPARPSAGSRVLAKLLQWWRRLTAMRTAIVLLFLLALAAVPGSLLPQRSLSQNNVTQFGGVVLVVVGLLLLTGAWTEMMQWLRSWLAATGFAETSL